MLIMKYTLLFVLTSFILNSFSQRPSLTTSSGLDSNFNPIELENAYYFKSSTIRHTTKIEETIRSKDETVIKLITEDTLKDIKTVINYYPSGKINDSTVSSEDKNNVVRYEWFENGVLKLSKSQFKGKFYGKIITNWEDGTKRRRDLYEDGELTEAKCFTRNGEDTTHFLYFINPEYKGGESKLFQDIFKRVQYPQEAREAGIQGKVYVSFVIEKEGSISDIKIVRGIGGGCDKEAIRVVNKMENWNPGLQDGEPIRVKFILPINFTLR